MVYFRYLVVVLLVVSCTAIQEQNDVNDYTDETLINNADLPEITFDKLEHDFGRIMQGEKVGYVFRYTNTGSSNLIVRKANASCGCTVPKFSKEPVPPSGAGTLEVIFDSSGRRGLQSKTITINSNAMNNVMVLTVKAEIIVEE